MSDIETKLTLTGKTVDINFNGASDHAIHATTAGKRFVVYHLYIEVGAQSDVTMKSAANAISGVINANVTLEFKNQGMPIFIGRAAGEDFVITLAEAVDLDGFAVIGESTV